MLCSPVTAGDRFRLGVYTCKARGASYRGGMVVLARAGTKDSIWAKALGVGALSHGCIHAPVLAG